MSSYSQRENSEFGFFLLKWMKMTGVLLAILMLCGLLAPFIDWIWLCHFIKKYLDIDLIEQVNSSYMGRLSINHHDVDFKEQYIALIAVMTPAIRFIIYPAATLFIIKISSKKMEIPTNFYKSPSIALYILGFLFFCIFPLFLLDNPTYFTAHVFSREIYSSTFFVRHGFGIEVMLYLLLGLFTPIFFGFMTISFIIQKVRHKLIE